MEAHKRQKKESVTWEIKKTHKFPKGGRFFMFFIHFLSLGVFPIVSGFLSLFFLCFSPSSFLRCGWNEENSLQSLKMKIRERTKQKKKMYKKVGQQQRNMPPTKKLNCFRWTFRLRRMGRDRWDGKTSKRVMCYHFDVTETNKTKFVC